jgi:hypothetical protein
MPLINIQQQAMADHTASPEDNVCAPGCLSTAELFTQEVRKDHDGQEVRRSLTNAAIKRFVVKSFPLNITKDGKPLFTQNFQNPTPR